MAIITKSRIGYSVPAFSLVCMALLSGCQATDHYVAPPEPGSTNVSFVSNRRDTVTFSVDARTWSHGESHLLDFSSNKYSMAINVTGHQRGLLVAEMRDLSGSVVRLDTISSDTMLLARRTLPSSPRYFSVWLDDFTGSVSLRMTKSEIADDFNFFQYPLHPGSQWVYAVRNRRNITVDTLILTSLVRTLGPDGRDNFLILMERRRGSRLILGVDTLVARAGFDTIEIRDTHPYSVYSPIRMVFPMLAGSQWHGMVQINILYYGVYSHFSVARIDTVQLPFGTFDQCFVLQEQDFATRWVVPGIGLVRQDLYTDYPYQEKWELVRYHIES